MTADEIRAAIAADPALQALVPDTQAIAAALSVGRTRYVETQIGVGTIIEVLGLAAAKRGRARTTHQRAADAGFPAPGSPHAVRA